MESVSILSLSSLPKGPRDQLRQAQLEAGRLWTECVQLHLQRRKAGDKWPDRGELHRFTKGRFGLHSQTIQAIAYQVLANVDATRSRRQSEPGSRKWLRYPYREKRFFPLYWPAQAVSYNAEAKRLVLPMGRGRKSLIFKLDLNFEPGAAKLVWNDGYELHLVRSNVEQASEPPGANRACVDLGEIHLAAVATDTGKALVISGRGIRSDKRLLSKQLGQISRKRSRCTLGSRRWKRLQKARQKRSLLARRRIRDRRHKATRQVIDFCVREGVGSLYVGDPRGVRQKDCGRRHNQRVARWEMGQDISYLGHKAKRAAIACSTGEERGTSSRCPQCGHHHKPRGRVWACKKCGFVGPRDVVGAANMHWNGFGQDVTFPVQVTYRRPSPDRRSRRSRLDTGQRVRLPLLVAGVGGRATGSPVRRKVLPPPSPTLQEAVPL